MALCTYQLETTIFDYSSWKIYVLQKKICWVLKCCIKNPQIGKKSHWIFPKCTGQGLLKSSDFVWLLIRFRLSSQSSWNKSEHSFVAFCSFKTNICWKKVWPVLKRFVIQQTCLIYKNKCIEKNAYDVYNKIHTKHNYNTVLIAAVSIINQKNPLMCTRQDNFY